MPTLEAGPFADLIPAADNLIGGENGSPAYQVVSGRFSEVPQAKVNSPTALGAFADLIPTGTPLARSMESGLFHDLIPQPPKPQTESEQALLETPAWVTTLRQDAGVQPREESQPIIRTGPDPNDPQIPGFGEFFFDPKVNLPRLEHKPEDSLMVRTGKSVANVAGEFINGVSSPAMIAAAIPMLAATAPEMVDHQVQRIKDADKTPAGSPERMEAALSTVGLIAGPAVAHGLSRALQKVQSKAPVRPASEPGAPPAATTERAVPETPQGGQPTAVAEGIPEASTVPVKPTGQKESAVASTYINGDKANYTGETREIAGGTFYVLKIVEGRKAGQEAVTAKPPAGPDPFVARNQRDWQEQQEGFRRLREREDLSRGDKIPSTGESSPGNLSSAQSLPEHGPPLDKTNLYYRKNLQGRAYKIAQGFAWDGEKWIHPNFPGKTPASSDVPPPKAGDVQALMEQMDDGFPTNKTFASTSDTGKPRTQVMRDVASNEDTFQGVVSEKSQPELNPASAKNASQIEPIGVEAAIAEIQRRNAPSTEPVIPKEPAGTKFAEPEPAANATAEPARAGGFVPAEDIFGFGPGAAAAGELPPWRKTATAMQEQINGLVARQRAERTPEKQTRDQLRTADKWLEADRNEIRTKLLDFSKNLPLAERAKFLPAITAAMRRAPILSSDPAVMYRRAEAVLNRMTEKVYDVNKKAVAGEIEKILTKTQDSKSMTVAEKEAIRERGNTFNQLKDKMSLDMLENMRERMLEIQKLGKELFALDQAMQAERTKAAIREITTQGTRKIDSPENVRLALGETESAWTRRINQMKRGPEFIKHFNLSLTPMDWMIQTFDRAPQGAIYRTLKVPVDVKYGEWLDASSAYKKRLSDVVKKHRLTEGQLDRVYAAAEMRQEGGLENLKALGYTEKELKALRLTKPEQEYLREADAINGELFPVLKDVLNKSFHQEIEQVQGYFPRQRDWDYYNTLSIEEGKFARSMNRTNTEKGFTVSRIGATTKNITNAHEVMMNHIDDALYHIKMGPEIRRVADVVKSKDFAGSVGNWGQKVFSDWVDVLSRNGGVGGGRRIHALDVLRKNVGMAQLAYRLTTTALQPVSLIQGMAVVSPRSLDLALGGIGSKTRRDFILKHFPEIRARVGDDPAYSDYGGSSIRDKLARGGFKAIGWLDRMAAMSIGEAAYRDSLNKRGIPFDMNKVDPQGVQDAQLAVRKTQSSAYPKDVPLAISRGNFSGNASVDKAIFQFQNFLINKWALMKNGALQMGIKEKSSVAGARIMTFMILGTIAEALARDGIKRAIQATVGTTPAQDKENRKEDAKSYALRISEKAAVDLVTGMPVVSNIAGVARFEGSGIPVVDTLDNVIAGALKIHASKKLETKAVGAIRAAQAAGALMGIPTGQAGDLAVQGVRVFTPKKKTAPTSPTMAF